VSTVHIVVIGANGRMGARVCALAREDASMVIDACVTRDEGASAEEKNVPRTAGEKSFGRDAGGVVIDFSSSSGTLSALKTARERGAALLVGTTGLDEKILLELREASRTMAVMVAANTSMGVCVMSDAVSRMARLLGPAYRAGIVEAHHEMKKDAPSGTAKRLAKAVRDGGGVLSDDQIVALRGGDVIGEHTVRFAGAGEYLEVTHRATTRDLFARGALSAAKWLNAKPAGWYGVEDVVGVRQEGRGGGR